MSDDLELLKRQLESERRARKEAENLLECKSLDLFQANQDLLQANAENHQLLDAIGSALIVLDVEEDRVEHWNPTAEATFGIRRDDAVGHPIAECGIRWDGTSVLRSAARCQQEKLPQSIEDLPYTCSDGTPGFLGITFRSMAQNADDSSRVLLLIKDVTERKILEGQLVQAQKLESIGQLAAGIAHEINTPAQYVGDNLEFLEQSFAELGGLLKKYRELQAAAGVGSVPAELVAEVEAAASGVDVEFLEEEIPLALAQSRDGISRVAKIVLAMKEFSHPGSVEKKPVDLNRAIESTVTVARNEWKYVAELTTEFDANLPPVPCIAGEFNQVVLNIVVNAAHALADAGHGEDAELGRIRISTRLEEQGWAAIEFSDTGPGMPEDIRKKVFDPFFTTKEVGKGTGQGLAIARSVVVDKHGGTIEVESEVGQGTTFRIRLPLADPDSASSQPG